MARRNWRSSGLHVFERGKRTPTESAIISGVSNVRKWLLRTHEGRAVQTARLLCVALVLFGVGCGRIGFGLNADGTDAAAGADAATLDAALATISFVQTSSAGASVAPQTTISTTLPRDVTLGNALIVGFDYDYFGGPLPTPTISDSSGAPYTILHGPDGEPGRAQFLAFAPTTASGPLTVTVTIDIPARNYLDLRVHEYAGISLTQPLDAATAETGNGIGAIEGPAITTTGPGELIIGFTLGRSVSAGPGMTLRSDFVEDVVQDLVAPMPGTYTAPVVLNSSSFWTTTIVALRPR